MRTTWITSLMMACLLPLAGCGKKVPAPPAAKGGHDHAHDHADEGPHHGQLIELGKEEYHAELTHDEGTNLVTVYLLDTNARKAVTTDEPELTLNLVIDGEPAQFKLTATDDEPHGSQFNITDERLGKAMNVAGTKVSVNVTIEGKPFTGSVERVPHDDDHDHDHDHDHADGHKDEPAAAAAEGKADDHDHDHE